MSTTTTIRPLTDEELEAIELPNFKRTYVKAQPKYQRGDVVDKDGNAVTGREFSASGPKADKVAKYVMHGGFTRQEIATFVGCSVSRVGEVLWAMDADGVEYPELLRRRVEPKAASESEPTESADEVETTEVETDDNTEA